MKTHGSPEDRRKTATVIRAFVDGTPLRNAVLIGRPSLGTNWLGHNLKKALSDIDELLIEGRRLEQLYQAVKNRRTPKAVREHLAHLWKPLDTAGNGAHAIPLEIPTDRTNPKGFWIFDWKALGIPKSEAQTTPITPEASDISEPPPRIPTKTNRILRDTELARSIKELHGYKCQMCKYILRLPDGGYYAEAHHIRPLGQPHNGHDVEGNILCLCARHHAEVDYGAIRIDIQKLRTHRSHKIDVQYVEYHNTVYGWSPE